MLSFQVNQKHTICTRKPSSTLTHDAIRTLATDREGDTPRVFDMQRLLILVQSHNWTWCDQNFPGLHQPRTKCDLQKVHAEGLSKSIGSLWHAFQPTKQ